MARLSSHIPHRAESKVQTCPKQSKNAPSGVRNQPFESILASPMAKYHSLEMTESQKRRVVCVLYSGVELDEALQLVFGLSEMGTMKFQGLMAVGLAVVCAPMALGWELDPETATWQDVADAYSEEWPAWAHMGDITGDNDEFHGFHVGGFAGDGTIAPDIVPAPWCYDLYGCVSPNDDWEAQREQNRLNWEMWDPTISVPDAYGATGTGENRRFYIQWGDLIIVIRPDGEQGELSELWNSLPDCWEGWRDDLTDAGHGLAAGALLALVLSRGKRLREIGAAVIIVGGSIGTVWGYCRHADGV